MIKQKLFDSYVRLRNKLNPYISPKEKIWGELKDLSIQEFSVKLNLMKYKSDPLFGLLDYTGSMKGFFNPKKMWNRDCDNYARAWFTYGVLNHMNCYEMLVTTKAHLFSDSHVICILKDDDRYWLCNYNQYGPFDTFELALHGITRWKTYSKGFISSQGISYSSL